MKKAISMTALYNKKRNLLDFDGEWLDLIGKPEMKGSWLITGHSGNGKTSFAVQLAKYLTRFGKVLYNSLEEGDSQSFELACRRENMEQVKRRFYLVMDKIEDLKERLRQKRSADIVIIDSYQYLGLSYKEYQSLVEEFENKLFIFISHADGKQPSGRAAKSVRYDSFVKIWVENYIATAVSRYGGTQPFVIWQQKAEELGMI